MHLSIQETKNRDEIPAELLQLLTDVGYVAIGSGKKAAAECIFRGILAARPENVYVYIASAFMHMAFGEYAEALKLLVKDALRIDPEHAMAWAFYGFLLHQVGQRGQARNVLERIVVEDRDEDAVALARKIIEEE